MADASALAGLLDRAGSVFSLARTLGREFEQEFKSGGPELVGEESPRERYREKLNQYWAAIVALSDAMENPPEGFAPVAEQLRKAGRLAIRIRDSISGSMCAGDMLGMFPDLNSVARNGRDAIKELEKAERLDDPLAFLDEPKASDTTAAVNASNIIPTPEEIRAKIQTTREQLRHPDPSHNPNRIAADAYDDYAVIVRMLEKCGIASPPLPDHRLHPLQTINCVLQKLDDADLALNRAISTIEQSARAYVADKLGQIGPTLDAVAARLLNPPDFSDAFAEVAELASRSDDESAGTRDGQPAETGFLGGAALANAIGVHPTRRDAFFRQLERQRMNLGDNCWHEVRDPRPNSPRFLYRADSPKLRDLAAAYKNPKST